VNRGMSQAEASPTAVSVSVVIPTYRRPALLSRCLAAVLAQRLDARAFEVIVVDDGQTDDTRAAVEALAPAGGVPLVRYLRPT
jgi:glycosyltransferase involved in cell wall biosynthesis